MRPPPYLYDGPPRAKHTLLLAPGAGAPMTHPFMTALAAGLAEKKIRVVRFNFPYMNAGKKVPDRQPVLLDAWRQAIEEHGGGRKVHIGGKSMGGRMASMIADEMGVRGLLCFGYPFHPPGQPEKTRVAHLEHLRTRTLIVQGTRDAFGTPDDVQGYALSENIRIEWLEGADHSLKKGLARAIELAALFIFER